MQILLRNDQEIIVLYKLMSINLYDCEGPKPTTEEFKFLVKSSIPRWKLLGLKRTYEPPRSCSRKLLRHAIKR